MIKTNPILHKKPLLWGDISWNTLRYTLTAIAVLMTIAPIYWIITTTFKQERDFFVTPPALLFEPTLVNYERVLSDPNFLTALLHSLFISLSVTILVLAVGSLAAFTLARYEFPGSKLVALAILSARLVPGATMIIPYFALFRFLHLTDNMLGLILAYTGFSLPFSTWLMYGFFLEIPAELEASARCDGCNDFQVFWKIALPLTLPGLGATAILAFLGAWNEFLFALVLGGRNSRTLPVYLATFISERTVFWGSLFAIAVVMIVPTLILTLAAQRSLIRGLTAGAVKG